MLNEVIFFDTLRQGLWVAVVISIPILTVALLAGVSIGLVQALTSIQEMTLTFVPKLAAIGAVFWLSMSKVKLCSRISPPRLCCKPMHWI